MSGSGPSHFSRLWETTTLKEPSPGKHRRVKSVALSVRAALEISEAAQYKSSASHNVDMMK